MPRCGGFKQPGAVRRRVAAGSTHGAALAALVLLGLHLALAAPTRTSDQQRAPARAHGTDRPTWPPAAAPEQPPVPHTVQHTARPPTMAPRRPSWTPYTSTPWRLAAEAPAGGTRQVRGHEPCPAPARPAPPPPQGTSPADAKGRGPKPHHNHAPRPAALLAGGSPRPRAPEPAGATHRGHMGAHGARPVLESPAAAPAPAPDAPPPAAPHHAPAASPAAYASTPDARPPRTTPHNDGQMMGARREPLPATAGEAQRQELAQTREQPPRLPPRPTSAAPQDTQAVRARNRPRAPAALGDERPRAHRGPSGLAPKPRTRPAAKRRTQAAEYWGGPWPAPQSASRPNPSPAGSQKRQGAAHAGAANAPRRGGAEACPPTESAAARRRLRPTAAPYSCALLNHLC
jgi:hypothetical protein